ncbi:MAG: phytanoyl-CoA dioxygenase family protein [Phycisphaeraceae bacterium]|nr:phytanoyl-CoA dioxygenase family protein [Phycisphaeraceae bacterium]
MSSPDARLTDEECDFFRDRGYVGPFRVVSEEKMADIRRHIEEDLLTTDGPSRSRLQSRHMDSPTIAGLASHPGIIGRMNSLYGPDLIMWATNFFNKEPGGAEIPWHQDLGYWPLEPLINISAWVAIDNVTTENSCVRIIPGSHKDVYPMVDAPEEMGFNRMVDMRYVDEKKAVDMELRPGEFFLFNEKTLHQSNQNTSDRRRMGMSIRVTLPIVKINQDGPPLHEGHRAMLVSGKDTMGLNRLMN